MKKKLNKLAILFAAVGVVFFLLTYFCFNYVTDSGVYAFEHDGQAYELTNKEIIDAIHARRTIVSNYWLSIISKESLYEPFDFEDWMQNELVEP